MAKTKPGIRISLDDSVARGTKFANKAGFDAGVRKLGPDSQPGPNPGSPGAPFFNSRRVDDFDLKRSTFWAGNGPTPGVLNDIPRDNTTMGFGELTPRSKTNDSPVPEKNRQMPNPATTSKAQEVRENDPTQGLGVAPTGTLSR
jgi:hypothetical protein